MIKRPIWEKKIQDVWTKVPIAWLMGVRRVGKTTLCKAFADTRYVNCDLSETQRLLADPEFFLKSVKEPVVVFDEIHQLADPSRILKIAADAFPHLKVLATGSSTLAATEKFRDSLTGRKRSVLLCPALFEELDAFGVTDIRHRLFRGGLPPALLSPEFDPGFFSEWLDSYFARDVQELFHVEKRSGFLKLLELLLRQSGGLMEPTSLARSAQLSRPTTLNYIEVFQMTHAIHVLRPYHGNGKQELVRQPKVYGFDTGFVCFVNGWTELRDTDCGLLWEHLVLDALLATQESRNIYFWRDKQKNEVDFVVTKDRTNIDVIECKWNTTSFDPTGLQKFRALYPNGRNFVVSPAVTQPSQHKDKGISFTLMPLGLLPLEFPN